MLLNPIKHLWNQQRSSRSSAYVSNENKFDLSSNLKNCLVEPFSLGVSKEAHQTELRLQEKQQWQAYELHYKLSTLLKTKYGDVTSGDSRDR